MKQANCYAALTLEDGSVQQLPVDAEGVLVCSNENLRGRLESNAKYIVCSDNQLTTLDAPKAKEIYCYYNCLTTLHAPKDLLIKK